VAYVNYTDLEGDTVIEAFDVGAEGDFDPSSRRITYTLAQPYANHNGGELLLAPDGASLLVFTGDGGSADDPERLALDPNSQLGKIVQLDLSSDNPVPRTVASGLRNPWRASYDATTDRLWIADVGQNLWEEINAVAYSDLEGTSFGWSAFEGTVPFNDDQLSRHQALTAVEPIHTYPHENDDCSISGGFVYRGDAIAHTGTWYLFADFCSGIVRALCADENDMSCGVIELGKVPNAVGILPDASGEPWVLSIDGFLVPLLPGD
jgi:glucose/arabinose dehydrogenase